MEEFLKSVIFFRADTSTALKVGTCWYILVNYSDRTVRAVRAVPRLFGYLPRI